MVRPGYTELLSLGIRYPSNILMVLVNKVVTECQRSCVDKVALGDIRRGRPQLSQELAVVVVSNRGTLTTCGLLQVEILSTLRTWHVE